MKPELPVSKIVGCCKFEQLILETVVILNSMSFLKEAKSGAFVAFTLCTSMVLFAMI